MKEGIYEKVLDFETRKRSLEKGYQKIRKIDKSELAKVIAVDFEKSIRHALDHARSEDDRLALIQQLQAILGDSVYELEENNFLELLALHHDQEKLKDLQNSRPKTSISSSSLFTGISGPSLESELQREIRTADKIDFLVSFIKFSGLRLIYDELLEFTRSKKLRVITTSYMGASDYKAILELAKLPNTEVKISYDKERTRLHAKAYYFHRETGFSTAYIGSSNLSNPALSSGLEWNVKLSEYTSKDVLTNVRQAFETYWNDDEFKTFQPGEEEDRRELQESLSSETTDDSPCVFFDLKPYSHQKEILEDLVMEREVHGSYKNLVVAATGERVIIVMGAINALKSGVSETLTKYNSCIA